MDILEHARTRTHTHSNVFIYFYFDEIDFINGELESSRLTKECFECCLGISRDIFDIEKKKNGAVVVENNKRDKT